MGISKWILPAMVSVLIFASCGESKEDKTENLKHSTRYNMISSIDHLAVVASIDLLKLIEKSAFESNPDLPMEASAGYKMMVKEKLDPEKTGIDLTGNNHFAISMVNPEEPEYIVFTAKVTNPENAKATVQEIVKGAYSEEEVDGDNYEFIVDDEIAFGWDASDIVVVFSEANDPKKIAKKLLQSRYVDGSDDDKGMEAYLAQEDDMNAYVQVSNTVDFIKAQSSDVPEEVLEALENAYYIGSGNFNNGEIVFEWDIHADELKNSEFNALATSSVNESFYNYLTQDKLIGFGTASIEMEAIFKALEYAESSDFSFEQFEEETGLSKQMMQEMFTGEFALSFVDIRMEEQTVAYAEGLEEEVDDFFMEESYTYNKEVPVMIFTAGISDSTKFGELLRASGEAKLMKGVYQMDEDAFIAFHADKLILTSDQETAEFFATGQAYKKYSLPAGANNETPLFGFVNTDPTKIPAGILKMAENDEGQMALDVLGMFSGVQFNGEFEHMEFRVEMTNKQDNALKVITDYILAQIKEKQMI
ncbi:DUF4836 family protein [Parvicella tangerina]|uniref:DUF4836 family protein n=1 Tax=Parvicella tangerina TaxID=2829795 RepID=A0A916NT20_9FLAO|nr:DUF4836 family protein [Parvicella tangerina]CAG5085117.1 hypothetical protein CRYO30217_02654 [Parvicella tangerina]